MIRENLNRYWEFVNGKPSSIPGFGTNQSKTVNLPHDFIIETETTPEAPGGSLTGYYGGGVGTYTKMLDIPEDYDGKRVLVEFDGSYMNTTVTLNGHTVTKQHYGYSPFHADLTHYMKPGKPNRLAVTVNNGAQPNARWYTGAGLYRHVDLLCAPKIHIAPWGIYAHTSHIVSGTAFVTVETTVENHTAESANVWVDLKIEKENGGPEVGCGRIKVVIPAGEKGIGRVKVAVENPELWDIDSPNLYRINAQLSDRESVLDQDNTLFGIRTISVDVKNGFMLNGRPLKLKGGCVHHDNGILGAASFYDSEFRKMKVHKDNGYNAIRFAHNPMARDMLEACDRLGLLVINEAFDVWVMEKNTHDYSQYFETDWKTDMEAFILRDRNHPSVIMWSTGNEVPERGGMSDGAIWATKLAAYVRELDPTRPIINSLCSFFNGLDDEDQAKFFEGLRQQTMKGDGLQNLDSEFGRSVWPEYTEAFCAPLDVVGYNYLNYHFEDAVTRFPNRVICSTESKPMEMDIYWHDVERFSHVIGDFNWTSHDYLGEAGIGKQLYVNPDEVAQAAMRVHMSPYPWRTAYDADFDLCGFERPQLAYRRIVWGSSETFIASHNPANHGKIELLGRWGWPDCENAWSWVGYEGKPTKVDIYSSAEEVELILNGKSLGRKPAGRDNRYTAQFDLAFEPGTLEAVSYIGGEKVSSDLLKTAGKPAGIRISPDKKELAADGQSLVYATVEIVDAEGNLVPTAEFKANAGVEGAATLAAFGNGRPQTTENYTKGEFTSYKGTLLAIVRAGYEAGTAVLTVSMDGLDTLSVEIPVNRV
ncbi:glycoside hydrolase family 2 TIM barrel-domain containing protein [Paenibacillus sp. LHD-38]|uniref:glycoside hydrolase family 2 TIM barrel-domain containing protein n=1 Tax=Paenibacillus sp. LHD-38 TaxID=3072143 RepID=UPI0028108EB8|nr:glycoside hydrolase family 2 TIM barrel-domain containing protein [Paenibacillus sp. LHD-38]MDQ8735612.1 glycoside hydrolase family 2 TIM barrel-domain containing protein [Paenibacillus sp. LHD-38]